MAQLLLSNRSKNAESLPENYIFPPERRIQDIKAPVSKAIPVIDLSQADIVQQIIQACEEFGTFQVINHGASKELMDEAFNVCNELFEMAAEDKADLYSEDIEKSCRLFTGGLNYSETLNCWKDTLQLSCFPLENHIPAWPTKPSKFREIMGRYTEEIRKLHFKIMDMICEGLGIEHGYFDGELSGTQKMFINYYPPCPDPSLAVGIPPHCDRNLITFLQQRDYGLQIKKDEQWIGVEPIPHALVVNVANQLEVISNGRLVSALHQAVTNSDVARMSVVTFIIAGPECKIEPAKAIISKSNPALFGTIGCNQFMELAKKGEKCENPEAETSMESLKFKA